MNYKWFTPIRSRKTILSASQESDWSDLAAAAEALTSCLLLWSHKSLHLENSICFSLPYSFTTCMCVCVLYMNLHPCIVCWVLPSFKLHLNAIILYITCWVWPSLSKFEIDLYCIYWSLLIFIAECCLWYEHIIIYPLHVTTLAFLLDS